MTAIHPDRTTAPSREPATGPLRFVRRHDRHLIRLLGNRDALAKVSTEQTSHGLPDAAASFAAMVRVEEEIAALYPNVHARLFPQWVSQVSRSAHQPGGYNPACSLCAARDPHHTLPTAA